MSSFYDKYCEFSGEDTTEYKDKYIHSLLTNGIIYKFIGFDDNVHLNNSNMECFKNDLIWASYPKCFEDKSELKALCDIKRLYKNIKRSKENITNFLDIVEELYDIACFATEYSEYMWENYANLYNGFCIYFKVLDTDDLFPIEYVNKSKVDLTSSIIEVFNAFDSREKVMATRALNEVSILPIVLKDKIYENEKELRLMYPSFDDENGKFKGRLYPNVKEDHNHKGTPVSYNLIRLEVKKVVIGHNYQRGYKNDLIKISTEKNIEINFTEHVIY